MTRRETARDWMVRTALAYLGTPYRWGGDDPSGFDCSGLAVECLHSVGLMEQVDLTADELYRRLQPHEIENPDKGCLVFWLSPSGQAYHVGLCLDTWFQISAGGGDQFTTTASDAWKKNAYVRIRPIPSSGSRCRFCDPPAVIME